MQSAKECQSNDIDNQHYPVVKCILRSRDFAGIDRDFSRLERFEQGIVEQSHTKDRYRLFRNIYTWYRNSLFLKQTQVRLERFF